jgi:hypothetical protein
VSDVSYLVRVGSFHGHLAFAAATEWEHRPLEHVFEFDRVGGINREARENEADYTGRVFPDFV